MMAPPPATVAEPYSSSRKAAAAAKLLAPIVSPRKRKTTFLRRRAGLMKKARELQTLCDVPMTLVCYGPDDSLAPQTFPPERNQAEEIINRYLSLPKFQRERWSSTPSYNKNTTLGSSDESAVNELRFLEEQLALVNKEIARRKQLEEAARSEASWPITMTDVAALTTVLPPPPEASLITMTDVAAVTRTLPPPPEVVEVDYDATSDMLLLDHIPPPPCIDADANYMSELLMDDQNQIDYESFVHDLMVSSSSSPLPVDRRQDIDVYDDQYFSDLLSGILAPTTPPAPALAEDASSCKNDITMEEATTTACSFPSPASTLTVGDDVFGFLPDIFSDADMDLMFLDAQYSNSISTSYPSCQSSS